jgi:hypothetical protein
MSKNHPKRILILLLCLLMGCGIPEQQDSTDKTIAIGPVIPADIEGGAFNAGLREASVFAWNQFIALNWLAVPQSGAYGTRGTALIDDMVPVYPAKSLRVWETLRAKTELFPGTGEPHGLSEGPETDYGYDRPPLYQYDPAAVGSYPGIQAGQIPACIVGQQDNQPPWVELSESHEVGPEKMYMGVANNSRVRYAVFVSRNLYRYVAGKGWLGGGNPGSTIPANATGTYIEKNLRAPPAGSDHLVSFPDQSLQIKTAWRRLSEQEKSSGRIYTAMARSYQPQDPQKEYANRGGNSDYPCYVDAEWGLVGMHIKTKTASAPYYIWSSFEHVDNITNEQGKVVEDEDGRQILNADLPATEPFITSRNAVAVVPATPATIQKQSPEVANAKPARRLYYTNKTDTPTTQGKIAINRRVHAIPQPVIEINQSAHQALRQYFSDNTRKAVHISESLVNYKLVGVQWKPADKPIPGQDLVASSSATNDVLRYPGIYYMANIVLETSYRLQNYSGVVQYHLEPPFESAGVQDLITDFDQHGEPVKNVMYDAKIPDGKTPGFNMGGCMGCHGQMQQRGYEFSFIFRRGRINAPETGDAIRTTLVDMVHPRTSGK